MYDVLRHSDILLPLSLWHLSLWRLSFQKLSFQCYAGKNLVTLSLLCTVQCPISGACACVVTARCGVNMNTYLKIPDGLQQRGEGGGGGGEGGGGLFVKQFFLLQDEPNLYYTQSSDPAHNVFDRQRNQSRPGRPVSWMNEWVDEWMNESCINEWMKESMNECVNDGWMDDWMNEWINQSTNE